MSPDLVGTDFGKYRILEKLGEGGMGAVYRAEDTRLGRHVAIKVLTGLQRTDDEARARFLSEARAASSLEHPNIATLYDFDEVDGQPFIAMQLVEGGTLKDEVARGPLSDARTHEVISAVANALSAAHAKGIVHRDVKCENVLVGSDGAVVLTDFGVARLAHGDTLTATDALVGTPAYMAPEQLRGERATPASDLFSLAAVAYECLTGARPFAGDNMGALVYAVLNEEPQAPSSRSASVAARWDEPVLRALRKGADDRYASVAEFVRALATPAAQESDADPHSLAVLYFDNLSSDSETDYFCAGITEDLLTDLSQVEGLRVASRNAVGRYRGQSVDVAQVASDLGVAAVVEGSVRKAGDRVRINAQLISAKDGFHMWAQRYDRTLDDVFAVQDDITQSIAGALRSALSPDEKKDLRRSRPEDVRAYDLYLKATERYGRYTKGDNFEAFALFEQATELDPNYGRAWAGMADCCSQMRDKGWDMSPEWLERARTYAERALEVTPDLPDGYKALSLVHLQSRDEAASRRALEKAVSVDPKFVPALVNLGVADYMEGDAAGWARTMRRVMRIDPSEPHAHFQLAWQAIATLRVHESVAHAKRAYDLNPSPMYERTWIRARMYSLAESGDFEGAKAQLEDVRSGLFDADAIMAARAYVDAVAGDEEAVRRALRHDAEPQRLLPAPVPVAYPRAAGRRCEGGQVHRDADRSSGLDVDQVAVPPSQRLGCDP